MKKELELYVHIPFCVKKCAYLWFPFVFCKARGGFCLCGSSCGGDKRKKRTVFGLLRDNDFFRRWNSFYIRGSIHCLYFRALRESFDIAENAEITMEVNPGTVSEEKDKHVENMRSEPVKYRSSIGRWRRTENAWTYPYIWWISHYMEDGKKSRIS